MTTTALIDSILFTIFAAFVLVVAVQICIRFYFREKRSHLETMLSDNMENEPEEEPETKTEREK